MYIVDKGKFPDQVVKKFLSEDMKFEFKKVKNYWMNPKMCILQTEHVQRPEEGELGMFHNWVNSRMGKYYFRPNNCFTNKPYTPVNCSALFWWENKRWSESGFKLLFWKSKCANCWSILQMILPDVVCQPNYCLITNHLNETSLLDSLI